MDGLLAGIADTARIASRCTKYGMCKVDYLSTGLCPPAKQHLFAAYFPQGRMQIATALHEGRIPVTQTLVDLVRGCILCNICNRQCYFYTELKPLEVMKVLAEYIDRYLEAGLPVVTPEPDELVDAIAAAIGPQWVSHDPAILVGYSQARSPAQPPRMPRCVVLPGSTQDVVQVVRLANKFGVPVMPRGNATSLAGALCGGIIVDLIRLDTVEIDTVNWCARIGAGVNAFDLQRAAHEHGMRANTAEPAACVCANIISTNLHSLYSHSYGMGENNLIDAEFVTFDGDVVNLGSQMLVHSGTTATSPPAICTTMRVKLHPIMADEDVAVVPFDDFTQAVQTAKDLGARRIGFAVGLVGIEYVANFTAVTAADGIANKHVLRDQLGVRYMLIVVGDQHAIDAVKQMRQPVLDRQMLSKLLLGLPALRQDTALELLSELDSGEPLYRQLFGEGMRPILEMALAAQPGAIAGSADPAVRKFLTRLYTRPHMTDVLWLTTFRIVSARIGRGKSFVPRIAWVPVDATLIGNIVRDLSVIGDAHGITNEFGYLVPVELGKRAIFEFDYFFDQTDAAQKAAMVDVMADSQALLDKYRAETPGMTLGNEIMLQGLTRPESYLYR